MGELVAPVPELQPQDHILETTDETREASEGSPTTSHRGNCAVEEEERAPAWNGSTAVESSPESPSKQSPHPYLKRKSPVIDYNKALHTRSPSRSPSPSKMETRSPMRRMPPKLSGLRSKSPLAEKRSLSPPLNQPRMQFGGSDSSGGGHKKPPSPASKGTSGPRLTSPTALSPPDFAPVIHSRSRSRSPPRDFPLLDETDAMSIDGAVISKANVSRSGSRSAERGARRIHHPTSRSDILTRISHSGVGSITPPATTAPYSAPRITSSAKWDSVWAEEDADFLLQWAQERNQKQAEIPLRD